MSEIRTACSGLALAEALRWRHGRLYFVDVYGKGIYTYDPAAGTTSLVASSPGNPGGISWAADGAMLVVSMDERCVMRIDDGELSVYADLSVLSQWSLNELVTSQDGSCYINGIGSDLNFSTTPGMSSIYLVDAHGAIEPVADDIQLGNGMVIRQERNVLVVAETMAGHLTEFDILPDGHLANRRVLAKTSSFPDGLSLDSRGGVWAALPAEGVAVRFNEQGQETHRLHVPERLVIDVEVCEDNSPVLYLATTGGWQADTVAKMATALRKRGARIDVIELGHEFEPSRRL